MQIAIAAISSLVSGGAATAGTVGAVGAAGATAATAATGLSSVLGTIGTASSILSGGTSILSAMRSMQAGKERAAEIEGKALDDRMQGAQRRTQMSREALDVLGSNDVAAAAAGIDLSYGVAAENRGRALDDYTRETAIDRDAEEARLLGYRRQSRQARKSGQLDGFLKLAEGGLSIANRGA